MGDTDGDGLTVRSRPTTASTSLGLVFDGRRVDVSCQARGRSVTNTRGFTSDLWDYVPALGGYLADAYVATGHDYRIPGVPYCGGSSGSPVPVPQFHGRPNQGEDCGPASVVFNDLGRVLAHVRGGRPLVLAGNMVSLPRSGRNVPHFLTVAGYDGDYLVLDPASQPIVHRASAAALGAYFDHHLGRAGVLL